MRAHTPALGPRWIRTHLPPSLAQPWPTHPVQPQSYLQHPNQSINKSIKQSMQTMSQPSVGRSNGECVGRALGDTVGKADADSSALAPPHSPPWTRTWLRQLRQGRLHLGARGCLAVPAPSSLLPYLPHALLDDVSHRGSSHMHALLHTLQPADLATKGVHLLRAALNSAWTAAQSAALCCISYKMAMVQQSTRDRVGPGPQWALAQRLVNGCAQRRVSAHMCVGGMCICVLVGSVGGVRQW
jgi:hypothetical protein